MVYAYTTFKMFIRYFVDETLLKRVPNLFIMLGCIYLAVQLLAVIFIRNPLTSSIRSETISLIPLPDAETPLSKILRSPLFYALWFTFLFNDQAIIAVTGLYKAFALEFWSNDETLTIIGSLGSVANAMGRLIWGFLADRFEYKVITVSFTNRNKDMNLKS